MGKPHTIPKNWPATIPYLSQSSSSPHLTKAELQSLHIRNPGLEAEVPSSLPRGPSPLVKIAPIVTPSHPANGQFGLFAARALAPGSLILPYYGVIHSSQLPRSSAHEKSDYDLWLDRDACLAVDADKAGNEARFVNDYRGVAERPNAEFRDCWDMRSQTRSMAVFVLPAGKSTGRKGGAMGIAKGQEILVSYGKGFWGKRKGEDEGLDISNVGDGS
ncbi:hypothetical protein F5Y15DRAFT_29094 [Xylariaceae sp. FL0016]|nr:hypothetical protein F5Y15DRAFT_29094 [Xylariaceae sp. FL0016]